MRFMTLRFVQDAKLNNNAITLKNFIDIDRNNFDYIS